MLRSFLAALAAALLLTPSAYAASPDVLVAHRGVAGEAQLRYGIPENSIPAWGKAIQLAQRDFIVDIDAQYAADGMIVMHDETINRTTNRSGRVRDLPLSYIKGAFLELPIDRDGNGNDDNTIWHPPSLNQALDYLKGKAVNGVLVKITIELKGSNWSLAKVSRLKDVLKSKGLFTARVNVHSFNNTYARYAHIGGQRPHPHLDPRLVVIGELLRSEDRVFDEDVTADRLDCGDAGQRSGRRRHKADVGEAEVEFEKVWNFGKAYAWVTDDLVAAQDFIAEKEPAA